jgi:hypothetical protein
MHSTDYIPHEEASFVPWANNFVSQVTQKGAAWGISDAEKTKLTEYHDTFVQKYDTAMNPATGTQAAIQEKNDAKDDFIAYIRRIYRMRILHSDTVTKADRDLLQVPIHDTINTPIPPPSTAPLLTTDTSVHLQHKLKAVDSVATRKRGGLPAKVRGVEIWRKIDGAQPADDSEFSYLATSTSSTHVESYALGCAGKIVWYRCRWVNGRNQPGPWSEIVSAIVP